MNPTPPPLDCADYIVIAATLYIAGLLVFLVPAGLYYVWRAIR
jgi:hypothetical protein